MNKHSSLLENSIVTDRKSFITFAPGPVLADNIKLVSKGPIVTNTLAYSVKYQRQRK
jgi:hypothetical protein